jgi:hypothetical protein
VRSKVALTFGRFNIGHSGHIELIKKLLTHGDIAKVYVSSGGKNNDWNLRVLLLRTLCRQAKVDLNRVSFLKAINPFRALSETLGEEHPEDISLVLGSDQTHLGRELSQKFDVFFFENRRSNSSSEVRKILDKGETPDPYKENRYAFKLSKLLRHEEASNEKFRKAQGKTKTAA